MERGIFIRDTLVSVDVYNAMSENKKAQLNELIKQYKAINYTDVRTELGPDQIRRMSKKQRENITNNMSKVFAIESKVKELLKTDEQLQGEAKKQADKNKQDRIKSIQYRIRDIKTYLNHKLTSKRENTTKKEYRDLQTELEQLTNGPL